MHKCEHSNGEEAQGKAQEEGNKEGQDEETQSDGESEVIIEVKE